MLREEGKRRKGGKIMGVSSMRFTEYTVTCDCYGIIGSMS